MYDEGIEHPYPYLMFSTKKDLTKPGGPTTYLARRENSGICLYYRGENPANTNLDSMVENITPCIDDTDRINPHKKIYIMLDEKEPIERWQPLIDELRAHYSTSVEQQP